jgi:MFS transporter, DHA2 family, multidrug resistance protein
VVSMVVEDPPWLRSRKSRGIDYVGLCLITIGLGCLQIMMDRGEDDDWFGSNFIRLMALLAFLGIFGAIGWLLVAKKPIVNIMVFKDSHFSIACLLNASAIGALYASSVTIPQFTQQVLPYTPTWAGLVLSPGGIAIMVLIPFVTALAEVVQTRFVIAFGFLVLGSGLMFGSIIITPDVDFYTLVMARTIQSAGFGFLLVPINTAAFRTLPRKLNDDGAALFAMLRNVSGSIGISLSTAAVTERTQVHQAYLSRWMTPLHQPFQTLIATYEQALQAMGRAGSAVRDDAIGHIYQVFRIQAAVLAYADIFMYAGIVAFIMIPLSFLVTPVRSPRKPSPHAGVRH